LRKSVVHFLSVILLICLLGLAATVGFSRDLGSPAKLESWLASSKIYDRLVSAELDQAQKSAVNNGTSGSVSLSDPVVKQAAQTAFSPALVQSSFNGFLDGNYNWLKGKTATPQFNIDLTAAKQQFAKLVGQAAQTHLAGLPVCTPAQLAQLSIPVDSESVTCRPPTLSPQAENARITQEVENSSDFLSSPTVTASSLNQDAQTGASHPYYQKLSWLPRAYRIALKLPWIAAGLGALCVLGMVFIAPSRRRGVRRIGVVLVEAGLLLILEKLAADALVKKFSTVSLHNTAASQLRQPINDFLRTGESQLTHFYLLFGILFLVIGLAILAYIFKTRGRQAKPALPVPPKDDDQDSEAPGTDASQIRLAPRRDQSAIDVTGPPPLGKNPPRPKRPRLIQ
jgi:hypothetical protein